MLAHYHRKLLFLTCSKFSSQSTQLVTGPSLGLSGGLFCCRGLTADLPTEPPPSLPWVPEVSLVPLTINLGMFILGRGGYRLWKPYRDISGFLGLYRNTNCDILQTLNERNFLIADFLQHQGAIERHASIDRSQIQHEYLQLLLIHLNLIL